MLANKIKLNPLLSPISFFYGIGIAIRNKLFDWGVLSAERFPVPVICVGNLSAGGTGKTPHTEYLVQLLRKKYKIAVLSRGYKRKTNGFILARPDNTSLDIGDESYQIHLKFPDILVAVDTDRRRGIKSLLSLSENIRPEVILLDDAFQHRYVTPSLSIVLTTLTRPFYNDKLLPYGRLREPAHGIYRADAVIVTKCEKNLKPFDYRIIEKDMQLTPHQKLFFTSINYGEIKPIFPNDAEGWSLLDIRWDDSVLLVAGIASPELFVKKIKQYTKNIQSIFYPDHHTFSAQDIKDIENKFATIKSLGKLIIVTEKDAARLRSNPNIPESLKEVLYYLPIKVEFRERSYEDFDDMILKHIQLFQRENKI